MMNRASGWLAGRDLSTKLDYRGILKILILLKSHIAIIKMS
jgi:hypothetical protein